LFQRQEFGIGSAAGAAFAPSPGFGRKPARVSPFDPFHGRFADVDLVPDLGARIGSREWWRGLATLVALCACAVMLAPGLHPSVPGAMPAALSPAQWEEARALSIAPLAWGGDTGRRMAANEFVTPLTDTPERPSIDLSATLGQGDGFARVLERAGVGDSEARRVADLVGWAVPLDDLVPGTRLDLHLGRRANREVARPLDALAFRARFDLRLAVERIDGELRLKRLPIAVDNTPLRITGTVGNSLYRSARAAGAPAGVVEAYLRAIATKLPVETIGAGATFDIIMEHRRAETGETETGKLLYAGIAQNKRQFRLLGWDEGGHTEWYDAAGVGERKGLMARPVDGRQTSSFGMRLHPLLGYSRMHQGVDFGAAYGTPIHAAADGVVSFAGRHGGHGNFVQLRHAGGIGTGYAHMSRIVARVGERVRQGEVIGYVGSTGLSTGPHLHYELYRNNVAVNPLSVKFTSSAQLTGSALQAFRSKLNRLLSIRAGAAGR
jgi:murein DD-endopeptidase MepM/ murein hydrolase activator NlpD